MATAKEAKAGEGGGLGHLLMKAAHRWRQELAVALGADGITVPQFFVMATLLRLSREGLPSQRQVAEQTAMDANTASQVVRALEREGMIVREVHPADSRAVALRLTARGEAVVTTAAKKARLLNERFFAGVDQQRLKIDLRTLQQGSGGET